MENYNELKQILSQEHENWKDLNVIINIFPDGVISTYRCQTPEGENGLIKVNFIHPDNVKKYRKVDN